jgi:hypothetical protein
VAIRPEALPLTDFAAPAVGRWPANPSSMEQDVPLAPWFHAYDAVCEGADFVRNQEIADIDALTLQLWPDDWMVAAEPWKLQWARQWVRRRTLPLASLTIALRSWRTLASAMHCSSRCTFATGSQRALPWPSLFFPWPLRLFVSESRGCACSCRVRVCLSH